MSRAYSIDLRERVVAAMASGRSARWAAATFDVSVASAVRWSQRQRRVGHVRQASWAATGSRFFFPSGSGFMPGWRPSRT
jgi:transposase